MLVPAGRNHENMLPIDWLCNTEEFTTDFLFSDQQEKF